MSKPVEGVITYTKKLLRYRMHLGTAKSEVIHNNSIENANKNVKNKLSTILQNDNNEKPQEKCIKNTNINKNNLETNDYYWSNFETKNKFTNLINCVNDSKINNKLQIIIGKRYYSRMTSRKFDEKRLELAKSNEKFQSLKPALKMLSENDSLQIENSNIDEFDDLDDDTEYLTDKMMDKYSERGIFDASTDDVPQKSKFLRPTFNFAAYANESETIQELVKLGVELWRVESNPEAMKSILQRNFDEIKPYIQFLHDCGVPADMIGECLTKFALIVEEDLDDLHTRIRFLKAHNFSVEDIAQIVTKNPRWLGYSTKEIDGMLGYIQWELRLSGRELRQVVVKQPNVVTTPRKILREAFFAVKEEMEFNEEQIKMIIKDKPNFFRKQRSLTLATFDYVYNEMGISHDLMAKMPIILVTPVARIKDRHEFLKILKRNQYDPTKPLYVSLGDFACFPDHRFCLEIAKTSIQLFDMFLKTR